MLKSKTPHHPFAPATDSPRGVSLLEILIALVLVVAIGAMVAPALLRSLDERAFESTADSTNEQLMMARAHAQASGAAVEVMYHPATQQVQVRLFDMLAANRSSDGFDRDQRSSIGKNLPRFDATDDGSPRLEPDRGAIGESWACQSLPHGLRLASRPPVSDSDDQDAFGPAAASADDRVQTIADLQGNEDIRLAVFMPDGSALVGDPVWLNDDKGRCGMFTINPWSGMPVFERVADHAGDAGADSRETRPATSDNAGSRSGRPGSRTDSSSKPGDTDRSPAKKPRPKQPASTDDDAFINGGG